MKNDALFTEEMHLIDALIEVEKTQPHLRFNPHTRAE